jgi:hypothetical protein
LADTSEWFTAVLNEREEIFLTRRVKIFLTRDPIRLIGALGIALLAPPASADGLQDGYWKVTSTPEINGQPAAPQEKMRCMTPAEVSDLDKTFSPEARTINSACERVEHEVTPNSLKWRLQCTGQMTMDVAGAFSFETPQRYVAEVRTKMSMPGQTVASGVKIVGERVGDCP